MPLDWGILGERDQMHEVRKVKDKNERDWTCMRIYRMSQSSPVDLFVEYNSNGSNNLDIFLFI